MTKTKNILVQNQTIQVKRVSESTYLSLTDIARAKNPDEPKDVVKNWLRSRQSIEFLGLWESINNPNFKGVEFDSFRKEAGLNSFTLSPTKWIDNTGAIGLVSKAGRYGGTFAHPDVAFEFASWISAEFNSFSSKSSSGSSKTKLIPKSSNGTSLVALQKLTTAFIPMRLPSICFQQSN